jgi:hypothetical protein
MPYRGKDMRVGPLSCGARRHSWRAYAVEAAFRDVLGTDGTATTDAIFTQCRDCGLYHPRDLRSAVASHLSWLQLNGFVELFDTSTWQLAPGRQFRPKEETDVWSDF